MREMVRWSLKKSDRDIAVASRVVEALDLKRLFIRSAFESKRRYNVVDAHLIGA